VHAFSEYNAALLEITEPEKKRKKEEKKKKKKSTIEDA